MNSAKFIAVCFMLMTLITMMAAPILSLVSAVMCIGVVYRCSVDGIDDVQYAFSAGVLLTISIITIWIMQ